MEEGINTDRIGRVDVANANRRPVRNAFLLKSLEKLFEGSGVGEDSRFPGCHKLAAILFLKPKVRGFHHVLT